MYKISILFLALGAGLFADAPQSRPQFSDYPVKQIFHGRNTAPILGKWSGYRTRIREGAKEPVEFAGHYTVPRWGCGAGCVMFVVVDSITGKIYNAPFAVDEIGGEWEESHGEDAYPRIEFHPDSRLMRFDACPNEKDCGYYDYIMVEGKGLKLIRKELLPKEYQPSY